MGKSNKDKPKNASASKAPPPKPANPPLKSANQNQAPKPRPETTNASTVGQPALETTTTKADPAEVAAEDAASIKEPEQIVPTDIPPLAGYEQTGLEESAVPPPTQAIDVSKILQEVEHPLDILDEYTKDSILEENVIRQIVVKLASKHRCWGTRVGKKMKIKSVTPYPALRYTLDSFCEERRTKWKTVPFRGGPIDSAMNGAPPGPWEIVVAPPTQTFQENTIRIEVPHTSVLRGCGRCFVLGVERCNICGGDGLMICMWCGGSGIGDDGWACYTCCARGLVLCVRCGATGLRQCRGCQGFGMLKTYVELTVRFHTVTSKWVYDRTHLPPNLLTNIEGQRIFEQCLQRVTPIQGYKIEELNGASSQMVTKHSGLQNQQRILYQGHNVVVMPITEVVVTYGCKNIQYVFWIYGYERIIHFPDFPKRSACTCS